MSNFENLDIHLHDIIIFLIYIFILYIFHFSFAVNFFINSTT